jgi:hypothetical protein
MDLPDLLSALHRDAMDRHAVPSLDVAEPLLPAREHPAARVVGERREDGDVVPAGVQTDRDRVDDHADVLRRVVLRDDEGPESAIGMHIAILTFEIHSHEESTGRFRLVSTPCDGVE